MAGPHRGNPSERSTRKGEPAAGAFASVVPGGAHVRHERGVEYGSWVKPAGMVCDDDRVIFSSGRALSAGMVSTIGHAYVHTVIDDHSRVAYAEIHDDESAATATAVLRRAVAWYTGLGVSAMRVLSENGRPTGHTCAATPSPGWASRHAQPGPTGRGRTRRSSGSAAPWPIAIRSDALPQRVTTPEGHPRRSCTSTTPQAHTALGGQPPITRLTTLSGQLRRYGGPGWGPATCERGSRAGK